MESARRRCPRGHLGIAELSPVEGDPKVADVEVATVRCRNGHAGSELFRHLQGVSGIARRLFRGFARWSLEVFDDEWHDGTIQHR